MLIALHIDPKDWAKLLGVWVAPEEADGFPECYYPEPDDGMEIGRGRMMVKGPAVEWSAFFWRLQQATPYSAHWSVREEPDASSLSELFERLAVEVVDSADALASATPGGDFSVVVPGVTSHTPSPEALCAEIGGPTSKFMTTQKLSTLCQFFADEHQLVIVGCAEIKQKDADLALAWGLAYRGDRQLSLILPAQFALPTRIRLPWLLPPVRVFTYEGAAAVEEPLPMTQQESIASYSGRTWNVDRPAVLGDKAGWVQPVLDWTTIAPRFDKVERPSYVSWHVAGRQVLKMIPTAKRLTVTAGVASTKSENWPTPAKVVLTDVAPDHDLHAIIAAAANAAAARLAGDDSANREHQMQAVLNPKSLQLAAGWKREFPAWRPGSNNAAFIDFLAKDMNGRLHVVETKIGADAMLIMQGLDYWLWCKANSEHANAALGATSSRPPVIDFVVAPDKSCGEPISTYTAAQAEALHRDIEWRFTVVDDPETAHHVTRLAPYRLPKPHRRAGDTPPRWAVRLHQHATEAATLNGTNLVRTNSFTTPQEALLPAALETYENLNALGLLHSHILHVRSSQGFALNMFAPLTMEAWTAIARHHLDDTNAVVNEPPQFEYSDPQDSLGEATTTSPHATQVDCLVRVQLGNGRLHAFLIEVKLSEDNFSTCSASSSERNDRRQICGQPGPFGGDSAGCFQLANHDREHRRRYDIALGTAGHEPPSFGCWFRDGANQVMRNAALAKALIARNEVSGASVILMAPDDHMAIWEQWHRYVALVSAFEGVRFADLPGSQVAALHAPDQARLLSSRYLLPLDCVEIKLAQRLVDDHFPNGAALVRLHNDGSINYVQPIARFPVVSATADEIAFTTDYPAGPFVHRTPRTVWTPDNPTLTISDPDGNGSRVITTDLFEYLSQLPDTDVSVVTELRDQIPRLAARLRMTAPWWTAPGPGLEFQ
jgi:restriction endonuclease-like protein